MPFAPVNGIDLFYESHGDGPAVVFLHGRGGNHLSWWQQVPHFSRRYRCIAIDHREFGLSTEVDDGPGRKAFADDLHQLLDYLKIDRACLVGQSMGGFTALAFALREPDRVSGLVLADTTGGIVSADIGSEMRKNLAALPADPLARSLALDFPKRDPERTFLYSALGRLTQTIRESLEDLLLGEDGPALAELSDWAVYKVPTLVIVGEKDVMVTPVVAHMVAAHLKGAKLEVIQGAGHSAYFEKPKEFNAVLDGFLATLKF
jgi:pimeloyl-ACP methyl ester carboxylesterase